MITRFRSKSRQRDRAIVRSNHQATSASKSAQIRCG
jgi:hypothetical protein